MSKALKRKDVIKAWKRSKKYLDYFCCPDCRDVLKKYIGAIHCPNIMCKNKDEYDLITGERV